MSTNKIYHVTLSWGWPVCVICCTHTLLTTFHPNIHDMHSWSGSIVNTGAIGHTVSESSVRHMWNACSDALCISLHWRASRLHKHPSHRNNIHRVQCSIPLEILFTRCSLYVSVVSGAIKIVPNMQESIHTCNHQILIVVMNSHSNSLMYVSSRLA